MNCKSPTHRIYRDALETLDVAAALAAKDLSEAREKALRFDEYERIAAVDRYTADAIDRLQWARERVSDATREVNRHFDRGCRNVPSTLTAEPVR